MSSSPPRVRLFAGLTSAAALTTGCLPGPAPDPSDCYPACAIGRARPIGPYPGPSTRNKLGTRDVAVVFLDCVSLELRWAELDVPAAPPDALSDFAPGVSGVRLMGLPVEEDLHLEFGWDCWDIGGEDRLSWTVEQLDRPRSFWTQEELSGGGVPGMLEGVEADP